MSEVTIREQALETLTAARPAGLSISALAAAAASGRRERLNDSSMKTRRRNQWHSRRATS